MEQFAAELQKVSEGGEDAGKVALAAIFERYGCCCICAAGLAAFDVSGAVARQHHGVGSTHTGGNCATDQQTAPTTVLRAHGVRLYGGRRHERTFGALPFAAVRWRMLKCRGAIAVLLGLFFCFCFLLVSLRCGLSRSTPIRAWSCPRRTCLASCRASWSTRCN